MSAPTDRVYGAADTVTVSGTTRAGRGDGAPARGVWARSSAGRAR